MEHEKNEPRRRPPERNSRAAQAAQQRRDQRREQAHLEELRQKLDVYPHDFFSIATVWGTGYKFERHLP